MPRRHPPEPDLTAFEPIIASAVRAFGADLGYATQMAARAVVVLEKRATWTSRKIVREAEAAARAACSAVPSFPCDSPFPCGVTTACRFSEGLLRDLQLPEAQ